jgi:predicted amidohydrolase
MEIDIAVAQMDVEPAAPAVNLEKAAAFVEKAAAGGAKVIVFPENFLNRHPRGREDLVDFKGKYREHFRRLARTYGIDIVAGSVTEGSRLGWFNTTHYIDSRGEILARYRKINLWLYEAEDITPGNEVVVADASYGRVGFAICWDLAFPELFRRMAHAGAEVVFCASFWCYEDAGPGLEYDRQAEEKFVDSLCVARAFENEICMVYCNAAGTTARDGYTTSIGHSQIAVPFKGALSRLDQQEELLIQRVDTSILRVAEQAYQIRRDLAGRRLW